MTKDERAKLDELAKQIDAMAIDISVIKTSLLGVSETENGGLTATVGQHNKTISIIWKILWVIVGVLIGLGILGGVKLL